MAATNVEWSDLADDAQEAFGWAAAVESGPHVGTRAVLIGIIRARPNDNPVEDLLFHYGIALGTLFSALRRESPPIDPSVGEPVELRDLPALTPMCAETLDRAARLQAEIGRGPIDVRVLLGALLEMPAGTAALGLDDVLPREAREDARAHYAQWLLSGAPGPYRAALESPNATSSPLPVEPSSGIPWPFLALLSPVGRDQTIGFGLLLDGGVVVASRAAANVWLPPSRRQRVVVTKRGSQLVALALEGPSSAEPPPRRNEPNLGEECFVATADASAVEAVSGSLSIRGGALELSLRTPLPSGSSAEGSPVVAARDGAVLGVVARGSSIAHLRIARWDEIDHLLSGNDGATPAPTPVEIGSLSGAGNDAVGDVDHLGFQTYVEAFADLITSPHTQPPLTIGIFGSWGMGKSFLLEHIEREIDRRQNGVAVVPRVHVVRFNAWEYSATDVVWPGVVRKIVSTLDELDTWPWHKRVGRRIRWNLEREWRRLRLQLVGVALLIAAGILVAVAQDALGVAALIGTAAAAVGVGGVVKAAKDPVSQWLTTLFAESDYGRHLGVMEEIRHDLETLEHRLHARDAAGKDVVTGRILVLIDDLDRCEPSKAVEVLQAVNLLLNFRSFVVCLGIDARIVTGAVEKHYDGLLGRAGASGYEYLDKIVQIPFRIPEPGRDEVVAFLAGQLGDPEPPQVAEVEESDPSDAAASVPAEELPPADDPRKSSAGDGAPEAPAVAEQPSQSGADVPTAAKPVPFTYAEREAFERFADHVRPNPRHLKRIINVYRLVRALARIQRDPLILENPAATIRWLVMWSQWPYASVAMLGAFDSMLEAGGGKVPGDAPDGEPMLTLLDRVEPSLDVTARARLDDDPAELRELLSVEGCSLTWQEIRRIRRYTVNFNPAVEERLREALPSA
jgi:KAP-like P-loop domain-containing protein